MFQPTETEPEFPSKLMRIVNIEFYPLSFKTTVLFLQGNFLI